MSDVAVVLTMAALYAIDVRILEQEDADGKWNIVCLYIVVCIPERGHLFPDRGLYEYDQIRVSLCLLCLLCLVVYVYWTVLSCFFCIVRFYLLVR